MLTSPLRATALTLVFLAPCGRDVLAQGQSDQPDPQNRQEIVLYVSPDGNDTWSGRLSAPNDSGSDGPLATIPRARDVVREMKTATGERTSAVTVMLREGVYRQSEAITFTSADSGTARYPITYQAFPGERPVVSGGRVITGWQPDRSEQSQQRCAGKLWRAPTATAGHDAQWHFNQLYVNDLRRTRARFPNQGSFLRTDGPASKGDQRGFYFHPGDVQEWAAREDVIFVVYHSWETSIHHVSSIDMDAGAVQFEETAPWSMGRWERQQRYYVENVFEKLDEPGEWFLDRESQAVYYYPLPGEAIEDMQFVAPVVKSTLVSFEGDPANAQFIEHLHFKGIYFAHTDSNLQQLRNPGQGEIYQPAMITASGLRKASFEDCTVAHAGAHGIWLGAGCEDNQVRRCHIHDLGGGGVYLGGGWGQREAAPAQSNIVDNNFIHDGGHLFHGAHGVWIGKSSHNQVTHNEISNFDYTGISCGWSWGFQPSSAHHNNLDYNHIHHLGNGDGLSDMGGIYTLGISPGTTERNNLIHDIYSYAHVSHGSGIYPDEGSSEIVIENNVVYRVRTCPLFQHYGKDNVVRNNVFAFGGKGQMQRCREDKPCHYVAEGNIYFADVRQMLGGVWENGDWQVGRNVYWSTVGEPEFAGMDFATWQTKAQDKGSIVADPLFVDPEHGDFSLRSDSPALKLGFRPIDFRKSGLYGEEDWVQLPKEYQNRSLNDVPAPVEPPFVVNFDFEYDQPGEQPSEVTVVGGGGGASLLVSRDVAAGGRQSIKFQDAPAQQYSWTPHLYCRPSYCSGTVHLSWDMLNSGEAPAYFVVEVRQWEESPYLVGPTVSVDPSGRVSAGGQTVGTIPADQWTHVELQIDLGPGKPKSYQLQLVIPDRDPIVARIPYVSDKFEKITWLGVSSMSNSATTFYLDNLKLGTPAELKNPRPRRQKPKWLLVSQPSS